MKENKITPYHPIPFRSGNKILLEYESDFDDGYGHRAILSLVDYEDKKGRLVKGYVLRVVWLDIEKDIL